MSMDMSHKPSARMVASHTGVDFCVARSTMMGNAKARYGGRAIDTVRAFCINNDLP